MTFVAGIDMGAKSTKAVVMDGEKRICGKATVKTRPDFAAVPRSTDCIQRGLKEGNKLLATTVRPAYVPFRDVQITISPGVGGRGFSLSQDPLRARHRRAEHQGASSQRHRQSARVSHQR